jgi:hypothetical protein
VAAFLVSGNISFNQANNPAFQELISLIKIDGKRMAINRKNVANHVKQQGKAAKEELLVELMENDSKVSLALDCWTSSNNCAFIGMCSAHFHPFYHYRSHLCATRRLKLIVAITGHWIDRDFHLHEALLTFKELTGSHTGENLASVIFDTLDGYNIAEKLHCITTDNASNNTKAMETLSIMLQQ